MYSDICKIKWILLLTELQVDVIHNYLVCVWVYVVSNAIAVIMEAMLVHYNLANYYVGSYTLHISYSHSVSSNMWQAIRRTGRRWIKH